jgi:hypothetical protein
MPRSSKKWTDTGLARIGTGHTNPSPIGGQFRKGTGNKCTIGDPPKCLDGGRFGCPSTLLSILCQSDVNPTSIQCQSCPIQGQSILNQSRVNPYQLWIGNPMPIRCLSSANKCQSIQLCANPLPILGQSLANPSPIHCQSIANPSPIRCQFIKFCANLMSIQCQSSDNSSPL